MNRQGIQFVMSIIRTLCALASGLANIYFVWRLLIHKG
jgi:hypothetical protein